MPAFAAALWLALAGVQSQVSIPPTPFPGARFVVGWGQGLAAGDLDGDGHVDVVTGGFAGSPAGAEPRLVVLWGDGHGGARARETFPVQARAVALSDLDVDGDLDVLTASEDGLHALLGDGAGSFSGPVTTPLGPNSIRAIEVGLLDGDLVPDVVVVSVSDSGTPPGFVAALLGDGSGGFGNASSVAASDPVELALGDFDGDGVLDLAVQPEQQLFRGDGLGGFVAVGALGVSSQTASIAAADVDLDGDTDLIVSVDDIVVALLGDGSGSFPTRVGSATGAHISAFHVGDVDVDGRPDVVSRFVEQQLSRVLLGDGSGGFAWAADLEVADGGQAPRSLALADMNGDGATDVLARNGIDMSFALADGVGGFEAPALLDGLQGTCVGLADLDGDSDLDAVSAHGGLTSLPGDGHGGFGAPIASPGPGQSALALGDFDGDGRHDVLLGNYPFPDDSPAVPPPYGQFWFGDGSGKFHMGYRQGGFSPSVADLDGDGDLDAFGSGVILLLGDGHGRFLQEFLDVPQIAGPATAVGGDVDLDGDVDVLSTTFGDPIALLENVGNGRFAAPLYIEAGIGGGHGGAVCMALGDLDQDGLLDLATGYYFEGVAVLWGTEPGRFGPPEPVALASDLTRPRDLDIGDADGDGRPDLLIAYEGYSHVHWAGGLAVALNRGRRMLEWTWSFGPGLHGVVALALGDVDGDARVDVLTGSGAFKYLGPVGGPEFNAGPVRLFRHGYAPEPECSTGERYCFAKLNSAGCLPRLCSEGTLSASGPDDFHVYGQRLVPNQVAILVWGADKASLPFGGGALCVAPPFVRVGPQLTGGSAGLHDCSGYLTFHLAQVYLLAQGLAPGDPFCAQIWARDPYLPAPFAIGLTDALRFVMGP